jgi:hypothetical protein
MCLVRSSYGVDVKFVHGDASWKGSCCQQISLGRNFSYIYQDDMSVVHTDNEDFLYHFFVMLFMGQSVSRKVQKRGKGK